MNKNIASTKKGFTLIELLVVISIIGLLSSIVMAAVSGARAKGSVAAGQNFDGHTYAAFYDDMVLGWDFDSATGGNTLVPDVSGNGNNLGIINGATLNPTTNPFKTGNSLSMIAGATAKTGSVVFSPSPSIVAANINNVPTGDFSISFWLYPTDASQATDYLYAASGITDKGWRFSYTVGAVGFAFNYLWSGVNKTTSIGTLPINTWQHIVAVCSSVDNKIGVYVNGKSSATTVISGVTCGLLNSVPLEIGKNTSVPFYIDNVRIYKKALPLSFIHAEYLAGLPKFEALARSMNASKHDNE